MNQSQFRAALLDPDQAVPEGLIDPQGRPAGKRFSAYRNNAAVGLTAALEAGFPVLRRLLGEEFFVAMAGVFLRAHPPQSRMMMFYGEDLADFLAEFPPVAHLPYLPDIARLELALHQFYHAEDSASLPAERLAGLSPDHFMAAKLALSPAVRLVRSVWPIYAIWQANTQNDAPAPLWQPESVLILRPGFDPMPHLISQGADAFMSALLAGETVADAVSAANETHDLATSLTLLLQGVAIVDLSEDTQITY